MTRDARSESFILLAMAILIGLGWVMVFSTVMPGDGETYSDVFHFLGRQVLATATGALALWLALKVPLSRVRYFAPLLLVVTGIAMLVVFLPGLGKSVARATRWIDLGLFTIQPVEMFKVAVVLSYAWLLADEKPREQWPRETWFKIGGLALLSTVLPILQRDFGSVVLMLFLGGAMIWLAGARIRYLLAFGGVCMVAAVGLIASAPYRINRIKLYLSVLGSADGGGYQIKQSLIALGAGGFSGVGLGESGQKLYYLPLAHADFIYSIIGEELGFIGAVATLGLYLMILHHGLKVAQHSRDRFTRMFAAGVTLLIFFQAIWHIAVALALVPTKGLALPFVSYGGSSLVASMLAIGLLLRCEMERDSPMPVATFSSPRAAGPAGIFAAGVSRLTGWSRARVG